LACKRFEQRSFGVVLGFGHHRAVQREHRAGEAARFPGARDDPVADRFPGFARELS
jgi:hypothetical protein